MTQFRNYGFPEIRDFGNPEIPQGTTVDSIVQASTLLVSKHFGNSGQQVQQIVRCAGGLKWLLNTLSHTLSGICLMGQPDAMPGFQISRNAEFQISEYPANSGDPKIRNS